MQILATVGTANAILLPDFAHVTMDTWEPDAIYVSWIFSYLHFAIINKCCLLVSCCLLVFVSILG